MSKKEDKRKLARTQGRFSGSAKSTCALGDKQAAKNFQRIQQRTQESYDDECAQNSGKWEASVGSPHSYLPFKEDDAMISRSQYNTVPKKAVVISEPGWHILEGGTSGESRIYYEKNFFDEFEAGEYFENLFSPRVIKWVEKEVRIGGEYYLQPRLVSWFGPLPYSYSGTVMEENMQFPVVVQVIKDRIEEKLRTIGLRVTFNSVLLNLYRHNKDSVAWHSDDELSMGVHPTIASVSLGAVRRFEIRRNIPGNRFKDSQHDDSKPQEPDYRMFLENGSLLIMDGVMQKDWQHRVPKEFHDKEPRINLTFRTVCPEPVDVHQ